MRKNKGREGRKSKEIRNGLRKEKKRMIDERKGRKNKGKREKKMKRKKARSGKRRKGEKKERDKKEG